MHIKVINFFGVWFTYKDISPQLLKFLFLDDSTGPAKVRRMIEHLRTDVVKGLGVKLLDRVLDIMQEEDEDKREVRQEILRLLKNVM